MIIRVFSFVENRLLDLETMSELERRVCWQLMLLLQLFIAVSCDTVSIFYNKTSVVSVIL